MSTVKKVVTNTKSSKSKNAKKLLENFVLAIDTQLEKYFNNQLRNVFGVSKKEKELSKHVLNHIKEHNLRPAKRLRGSFVYYGYKLLGGKDDDNILKAAMCIEVIHTALLMHDDFVDQDDTRRGLPTSHEYYKRYHVRSGFRFDSTHYGEGMGVNAGDIALMLGFRILSSSNFGADRKIDALNRTLTGIANTAYGQAFDITLEGQGKASEKDITDLHLAKTAIYTYENPLHIGAILAGANKKDLELISKYAIPGGVAFQLQDDILGLFGSPEKTGKPAHSDLRQGKMTLLIVKALELADKRQKAQILKVWGKRNLSEKDAEKVRNIIAECGSLDYSRKVSVNWAKKAQLAIPDMYTKGWNKQAIEYLDGIAQYMVERDM